MTDTEMTDMTDTAMTDMTDTDMTDMTDTDMTNTDIKYQNDRYLYELPIRPTDLRLCKPGRSPSNTCLKYGPTRGGYQGSL